MEDEAGISALPDQGSAGIGSLWSQWDALMQSLFGDSVVRRTIAARDALRRGDAQAAHEATMPVARDLASFVGNIQPVGRGISALVSGSMKSPGKFQIDGDGYLRLPMRRPSAEDIAKFGGNPDVFSPPMLIISPDGGEVIWKGLGTQADAKQMLKNDLFSRDPYYGRGLWEPSYDGYWRGTSNKSEIDIARAGSLRKSRNVVDGTIEPGVSVSRHVGTIWADYPYGYQVRGNQIGVGSDGEPVLDPRSIEPITKLLTKKKIIAEDALRQKKIMEKLGIPEDVYRAMASGKFFLEWGDR